MYIMCYIMLVQHFEPQGRRFKMSLIIIIIIIIIIVNVIIIIIIIIICWGHCGGHLHSG